MSLRYFDRGGAEISQGLWLELYADVKYAVLAYASLGGEQIACSWVGLFLPQIEKRKLLFVVENWFDNKRAADCVWFTTEGEALSYYERLRFDLQRGRKCYGKDRP